MSPEEMLAKALLAIEPPKVTGGSKVRRDWLSLVLTVQGFILRYGLDDNKFRQALLEEDTDDLPF